MPEARAAGDEQPIPADRAHLAVCARDVPVDGQGLAGRPGDERARSTLAQELDAGRRPYRRAECHVLLDTAVKAAGPARRLAEGADEVAGQIGVVGFDTLANPRRPRVSEPHADLARVVDAPRDAIDATVGMNRIRAEGTGEAAFV